MLQLFINNELCDLKGDENISIDYAMMSIEDISKRKGSRSFTFEIPKTVNNSRILEVSEQVTNLTQIPYTKLTARLKDNGIDLGIRFAELVSVKKNYSINLYGDNASFYDVIKNKALRNLDLSEFNHVWNLTNIFGSRLNDVGDGYIYPIINYGSDENVMGNIERNINAGWMLPAMYLDDVMAKIFSEAGYTLVNKMLEDTDYTDNPIILPSTGLAFSNKYNAVFGISTDTVCTPTYNTGYVHPLNLDSLVTYTGNYYSLPYNSFFRWGGIYSFGKGIGIVDNFNCRFRLTAEIENTSPYDAGLALWLSGDTTSVYAGIRLISGTNIAPGTQTYVIEGELNDANPQWYGLGTKLIIPIGSSTITIKAGATFEIYEADEFSTIYLDGEVDCASCLPDIQQADLIKNYCQMFCLLPIVDEENKTVTLVNFNKIEKNINEAVDWSEKLDLTEPPEVKFLVDDYAQNNLFKWLQDGDEEQPTGTNAAIKIENENLEPEKDIVELAFASTLSQSQLLDIPVPRIGIAENGVFKSTKKPRMLILYRRAPNDFADTSDFIYSFGIVTQTISGASEEIPLCRFIDTEFDYNLGFGNNLLDYYSAIRNIVTDYKNVNCLMRLNASDINTLDFIKPVYIKYFNAYFYVSGIKGYNGNKSTEVELVKLY